MQPRLEAVHVVQDHLHLTDMTMETFGCLPLAQRNQHAAVHDRALDVPHLHTNAHIAIPDRLMLVVCGIIPVLDACDAHELLAQLHSLPLGLLSPIRLHFPPVREPLLVPERNLRRPHQMLHPPRQLRQVLHHNAAPHEVRELGAVSLVGPHDFLQSARACLDVSLLHHSVRVPPSHEVLERTAQLLRFFVQELDVVRSLPHLETFGDAGFVQTHQDHRLPTQASSFCLPRNE
mmetsp:Transcript_20219/g.67544  ORF Transcript_20219/g.67544 Transcript_20219/m.67544 type:complete len:233 (+) Transcript_20219:1633-2331(+)